MDKESRQKEQIIKYLLGDLTGTEQESLEENYFNDDDLFLQLLETEDQLIVDYLHGSLGAVEREKFERHYLSNPERKRKVEIISFLSQSKESDDPTPLNEPQPGKNFIIARSDSAGRGRYWFLVAGLSATALILLITAVMVVWRPEGPGRPGPESLLQTKIGQSNEPAPGRPGISTSPAIVKLSLSANPRRTRAASRIIPKAMIDPTTTDIELTLKLSGKIYPSYLGQINRLDNNQKEVYRKDSIKPVKDNSQDVVILKVGTSILTVGDYQMKLSGKSVSNAPGDTQLYDFNVRGR